MQVFKLLEYLLEILDTSAKIPLAGKAIVDKKEMIELVNQIIQALPEELKKAQWITSERERILSEAIQQAEELKSEKLNLLKRQIENHDITKEATLRGEEIIASAQKNAKAMRLGARDYSLDLLAQLDEELNNKSERMLSKIKVDIEKLVIALEEDIDIKANEIKDNIKELKELK